MMRFLIIFVTAVSLSQKVILEPSYVYSRKIYAQIFTLDQGDEVHEVVMRKVIILIDSINVAIFLNINIQYYIEVAVSSRIYDPIYRF